MRKLVVAVALGLITTLSACDSDSNSTANPTQPPGFTPPSSEQPTTTSETKKLVDAISLLDVEL